MINCPHCGGTHFGSGCPFISRPCVVCGIETVLACADCAIDFGGQTSVHICERAACRQKHENTVHHHHGQATAMRKFQVIVRVVVTVLADSPQGAERIALARGKEFCQKADADVTAADVMAISLAIAEFCALDKAEPR